MTSALRPKITVAFFAFVLLGAYDGALGVLLPSLRGYYHVDNATIGLIFLASTLGFLLASFNNGLLVEKLSNRRILMLGAAIFFVSVGIISLMPPFFIMLGAVLCLGFGMANLDAGLNTYIASLPRNTALLNYLHTFYGVGALLGPIIASGLLVIHWGWNSVYWVWSAMSLLLLIGFGVIFKEQSTVPKHSLEGESNVLLATLKLRIAWLAAIFLVFYTGSEVSLGSWSYSYLTEGQHGAALISGWIVSGYWLGLTLGRATLARVAQRVGNKRLIQACLLGVVCGLLLVWFAPTQIVSAIGLWITGFSLGPIFPTTIAFVSTRVSARMLPGVIGFITSLGSMGAALFPWLAGNLTQRIGLWSLLPYVILLTVGMLCLWLALQSRGLKVKRLSN